ncbi:MAG: endo-1,4-beta-xylanase [Marinilabiliaceae bacterium]|nr:endo-1,4-beta-xylanase [Marinilabiliaceae bacterium]
MAYEANREYVLKFKVKGTSDGVLRAGFQNSSNYAGCGDFPEMPFTTEWTDVRVSTTASEGVNRFLFSLGDFEGSLFLDNVQMIKKAIGGNKSMSLRPAVVEFASLFANDKFVRQGVNKASGANYRAIKVPATAKVTNPWDNQFFIRSTQTFKAGDVTHISFRYRATKAASVGTQCHNEPGSYMHWMAIGNVAFTDEWQDFDMDFTIPAEGDGMRTIAFNLNDFAEENDYYFDDWSWTIGGVECIVNGNCEGDDNSCFFSTVATVGPNPSQIVEIAFPSIVVHATAKASQAWDNQFFIVSNEALPAGTATHISFTYKATAAAKASTQCHNAPGAYMHWFAIGDVQFSKEWQDFDYDFTVPSEADGMKTIAFNLSEFADANDYYIRNVKWTLNGKDLINNGDLTGDDFSSFVTRIYQQADVNSKPEEVSVFEKQEEGTETIKLTPEEKKDTLTWAMDKWIKGMMEVTAGRVKAWDVVNEPIGGFDGDGDGKYDLQHASTASDDDKKNNFYWQDYLGDVDYVRIAISRARMYYKQYGGNPDDLKLFINDYNLESHWDDNAKLKGLIAWCNEWENDTIKIDGIGTQMHVSYDVRQGVMDSQKQHIVNMFKLMAATGKLVKISELDMGYVDANGDPVMTKDITVDQEIQMSDFYNFIVKAYFENVPASQRYGITLWSPTDSPAGSGWRGGQPIGLWTEGYQRKPAYAGVADGLAGK